MLVLDKEGKDYYRQFKDFDKPVFINLAEEYLANKPQFYLTNAWSDVLNEEYRRKGTFKNEYIYDMIIMGFLKYEVASDTYSDSLINRTQDFETDLYSVLDKELDTVFDKSKISDSTMEFYHNNQTISDLGLAMNVVDYAEESYEIYLDVMASKMALLESNRDKLALFSASVNAASDIEDNAYVSAMNLIIDAMNTADPARYLNQKTDVECSSFLLGAVEDVVKEINPIFQLLDLSVSGIDLVFNSSNNASNDIKLAYFYLADSYLRQGLYSIVEKYINLSDPSNKTSENAREFIDAFKTYLLFQKFGNIYANEWLDNYIQVRSTPIKKWFNKKNIQNALDMKQQCASENSRIDKMLRDINELEKEEDVWKIIIEDKDSDSEKDFGDDNGVLEEYAHGLEYLYGQEYTGYITDPDIIDNTSPLWGYDISEIPIKNLGYFIWDFDKDEIEELLIFRISQDYSVIAEMYEALDSKVVKADSIEISADIYNNGDIEKFHIVDGIPAFTNAFIYDFDNEIRIGLEFATTGIHANGTSHSILSYNYDGNDLIQKGISSVIGSTIAEDISYDSGFAEHYKKELNSVGVKETVTNEELISAWNYKTCFMEYVPTSREVFRIKAEMLNDGVYMEWYENNKEKTAASIILFGSKDELYEDTSVGEIDTR